MQWLIDLILEKVSGVPSGTIVLWHDVFATIPAGWFRCNGDNGTPDLRGRFVRMAGGGYPILATGGVETHSHEMDLEHNHDIVAGTGLSPGVLKNDFTDDSLNVDEETDTVNHVPPFINMWYIMKGF